MRLAPRDPMRKGLAVALAHVLIVASLGGKLLFDRATRPRVWARTAPVDPNLPIRGRYVRLGVEAVLEGERSVSPTSMSVPVALSESEGRLVARPAPDSSGLRARAIERGGERVAVLQQPLAYFIPEHAPDPSLRRPGEELWVEVTLPRRGPPRPIRLGVKKDGVLTPLDFD